MNVKCSKKIIFLLFFAWVLTIAAPIIIFFDAYNTKSKAGIIISIILTILLQIIMLRASFVLFKKVVVNENGCIVKLLFFKKVYSWSEIQTKSIEYYDQRLFGRRNPYEKGCVFSAKKNFHTPETVGILSYLLACINPFSFFVLLFAPTKLKGLGVFEVDENLFMEKMNEWGVELQEYKNGEFRPYKNYAGKTKDLEEKTNNF